MIDLALDPATHDLDLTGGGASLVTGRDADRQDIDQALRFFEGEWFLAPRDGLPWFDRILIRNVNEGDVLSIVANYLQQRDSVQNVDELDVQLDTTLREVRIVGRVTDSTGATVDLSTVITL